MSNSEFLDLAEHIGLLIRGYDKLVLTSENADLLWSRTKFHIKLKLDEVGLTPEQFDARMKVLAGPRRRITKLSMMQFE